MVPMLRGALTPFHPRGRKWLKFLRSFTLDPDEMPRPVSSPGSRDFIICGAPRTGTTLLSAMLFQPPNVVTVVEPWAGMQDPPARLFASIRNEIDRTGVLHSGKLDVEELMSSGVVRRVQEGESTPRLTLSQDYLLGIKWPAFWRYLDKLPDTKFLICVRHPQEVIASFRRSGGRLAAGLEYDLAFNRRTNIELETATRNIALRRVLLYEHVLSHIIRHLNRPNVRIVHYERWFIDARALLDEIGTFLDARLDAAPASVRPQSMKPELPDAEIKLIVKYCRTAESFGYQLQRDSLEHRSG